MTEQEKTDRFLEAIEVLGAGSDLMVLDRHEPDADARPNECFANCQRRVARSGGAAQCGWVFNFRRESDYVVATAHAVWRSPDGDLIDITPMLPTHNLPESVLRPLPDIVGRLVFLPDAKAFKQPNKYLPLTKNRALVKACRQRNRKEWHLWRSPSAIWKRVRRLQRMAAGR